MKYLSAPISFTRLRQYHASWWTMLLVLLGAFIVYGWIVQAIFLQAPGFYVTVHIMSLFPPLARMTLFTAVTYGLLLVAIPAFKRLPWQRSFAIVIVYAVLLAAIGLSMHPTQSQDIYWSLLLGKGFAHYGYNPYQTTPADLAQDSWATPVLAWREMNMVYGPLWTLIVSSIALTTSSLEYALLFIKILMLVAIAASSVVLWRIMAIYHFVKERRALYLALILWSPFLLQNGLIDAHNDVLVMLSITMSYYLFLKQRHSGSALTLFFGGLVKYTPWLVLPVPLIALLWEKRPLRSRIRSICLLLLFFIGVGALTYAPFGFSLRNFRWAQYVQTTTYVSNSPMLGAALVSLLSPRAEFIYPIGVALAAMALAFCIFRKKMTAAYIMSYSVWYFFGARWFQSWYVLWVLPLLPLFLAPIPFILLNSLLYLGVTVLSPILLSLILIMIVAVYAVIRCFRIVLTEKI